MKKLKQLKETLKNDLRGLNINESDWAEGFILRYPCGTAAYTVYCAENGYSAYVAWCDAHGYDLANEIPLCENVPCFTAVSKIKTHQITNGESYLYESDSEKIDTDFRSIDCFRV